MNKVKLTDRDIKLLYGLYENVFLSFEQIKKEHFQNCAGSTVYNRLSKLSKSNLIGTVNVNIKSNFLISKDIGVIYFVTKLGLSSLKEYWHKDIYREIPVAINFNNLMHDLLLTDTNKRLKEEFNCHVVNSRICDLSRINCEQVPDAILFGKDQKRWAIELELTAKSNQRYREIVTNYQTNNFFEKVLYVVKNEAIHKKILNNVLGYSNHSHLEVDTGKFKFLYLKDFVKRQNQEVKVEL